MCKSTKGVGAGVGGVGRGKEYVKIGGAAGGAGGIGLSVGKGKENVQSGAEVGGGLNVEMAKAKAMGLFDA